MIFNLISYINLYNFDYAFDFSDSYSTPVSVECGYYVLIFMKEIVLAQSCLDVINTGVIVYTIVPRFQAYGMQYHINIYCYIYCNFMEEKCIHFLKLMKCEKSEKNQC